MNNFVPFTTETDYNYLVWLHANASANTRLMCCSPVILISLIVKVP